jgi:hypothetical protein
MNNWIQAPLGFQTQNIVFRAEQHTAQTITTSAVVAFDTVVEDPYSGWDSGSHLWLAPYSGWYIITSELLFNNVAGMTTHASVYVSGTIWQAGTSLLSTADAIAGANVSAIAPLIAGADYVQIQALVVTSATTLSNAANRVSSVDITYISQ